MRGEDALSKLPIVAILRGVTPDRVAAIAETLVGLGISAIEVPLNSPQPFESIKRLREATGASCLCGAGTVLRPDDVNRVRDAGGDLIVTPNCDARVIVRARTHNMMVMPGFATASEAFAAIDAGATWLKLFPASSYGPSHLKSLRAVLPTHIRVFAVGGIGADRTAAWAEAGAAGFGFGSELFKPDYSIDEVATRARDLVESTRRAMAERNK